MDATATLDLRTGANMPIGTPVENFRATGDQTVAWRDFAPRVKDSTAPTARFYPSYDAATDTTLWVASDVFWGTLIMVQ
jgi:hypothetical protein